MTKQEALNLYRGLSRLNSLTGVKFSYFVARNTALLETEIKAMEKTLEVTPEFEEFEKERIDLAKKHAKKDEEGKPKIIGNQFEIENTEKFDKELETLKQKHEKAVSAREKQIKEYNNLLKEESDIKTLHKIKLEDIPEEISVGQMNIIKDLIE